MSENTEPRDAPANGTLRWLWLIVATAIAGGVLVFWFRNLDLQRLQVVFRGTGWWWVIPLIISTPLEQIVRGFKWRQILYDIRPVGTLHLFGAVMAGYFANMIVPLGISPFVRAWLVARAENLKAATVLLTSTVERFVDGAVFACLIGVLVVFSTLPATQGNLLAGLLAAAVAVLVLSMGVLIGLFVAKRRLDDDSHFLSESLQWLEDKAGGRLPGLGSAVAAGIVWPHDRGRRVAVVAASVVMKMISATHFLWAGLAIGVLLAPFDYLFLLIFGGVALVVSRFIRIPGGFVIGSAFALNMLGVADEEALVMVLLVHVMSMAVTSVVGALAFWNSGVTISDVRRSLRKPEA
ncbi:MAG: lysylphosphatidylglycerol synthase transmembrane domain-containing protein [Alphaproteobacteria bacterium]